MACQKHTNKGGFKSEGKAVHNFFFLLCYKMVHRYKKARHSYASAYMRKASVRTFCQISTYKSFTLQYFFTFLKWHNHEYRWLRRLLIGSYFFAEALSKPIIGETRVCSKFIWLQVSVSRQLKGAFLLKQGALTSPKYFCLRKRSFADRVSIIREHCPVILEGTESSKNGPGIYFPMYALCAHYLSQSIVYGCDTSQLQ